MPQQSATQRQLPARASGLSRMRCTSARVPSGSQTDGTASVSSSLPPMAPSIVLARPRSGTSEPRRYLTSLPGARSSVRWMALVRIMSTMWLSTSSWSCSAAGGVSSPLLVPTK